MCRTPSGSSPVLGPTATVRMPAARAAAMPAGASSKTTTSAGLGAQQRGGREVAFRMGLAAGDDVGGNGRGRHGESGGLHPDIGQDPVGRGDQRDGIGRQGSQQFGGSGQRHDAVRPDPFHLAEFRRERPMSAPAGAKRRTVSPAWTPCEVRRISSMSSP